MIALSIIVQEQHHITKHHILPPHKFVVVETTLTVTVTPTGPEVTLLLGAYFRPQRPNVLNIVTPQIRYFLFVEILTYELKLSFWGHQNPGLHHHHTPEIALQSMSTEGLTKKVIIG